MLFVLLWASLLTQFWWSLFTIKHPSDFRSTFKYYWMVFGATMMYCKAILGKGQPGLMRWILVWNTPQVQDWSHTKPVNLQSSSPLPPACYDCPSPPQTPQWLQIDSFIIKYSSLVCYCKLPLLTKMIPALTVCYERPDTLSSSLLQCNRSQFYHAGASRVNVAEAR